MAGESHETCGEFDIFITFATRLNWTPSEVMELDPDYVEELIIYWQAEAELKSKQRKEQEKARSKKGRR